MNYKEKIISEFRKRYCDNTRVNDWERLKAVRSQEVLQFLSDALTQAEERVAEEIMGMGRFIFNGKCNACKRNAVETEELKSKYLKKHE